MNEYHSGVAVPNGFQVGTDGFLPLTGTHMIVWCNRWFNEIIAFVLLQGESYFILSYRKLLHFGTSWKLIPIRLISLILFQGGLEYVR